jgi:membrane associated rhomboid family serine protease
MSDNQDFFKERRQFINAIFIPVMISVLIIAVFLLEKGMGWDFHTGGVYPGSLKNLWGIFTMVFIHNDWGHLTNNIISFVILGSLLYYFYMPIANKVMLISYLASGLILWVIGRDSWHIGASGLIYSLAFFLFFSGMIRKHIPLIAISLIVAFVYGGMIWHIFPWQVNDPISWEGHLAGGLIGLLLSFIYRNEGPQKPVHVWEDEDDSIEYIPDEDDSDAVPEKESVEEQ